MTTTVLLGAGAFTVVFTAAVLGAIAWSPDSMLDDYPPRIQQAYGRPQSPKGKRVAAVMSLLLFLGGAACAVATILALRDRAGGDVGFWPPFVVGVVFVLAVLLWDLVVIDWLILCTWQPRFMILPGTHGHPDYRDYRFHWTVMFPHGIPLPVLFPLALGLALGLLTLVAEGLW